MRASSECGGNDLLQCSQVGRSSSMAGLLRFEIVVWLFYVFKSGGSMGGGDEEKVWPPFGKLRAVRAWRLLLENKTNPSCAEGVALRSVRDWHVIQEARSEMAPLCFSSYVVELAC